MCVSGGIQCHSNLFCADSYCALASGVKWSHYLLSVKGDASMIYLASELRLCSCIIPSLQLQVWPKFLLTLLRSLALLGWCPPSAEASKSRQRDRRMVRKKKGKHHHTDLFRVGHCGVKYICYNPNYLYPSENLNMHANLLFCTSKSTWNDWKSSKS